MNRLRQYLNLQEEIISGRLNIESYIRVLTNIFYRNKNKKIIISDIDGVVFEVKTNILIKKTINKLNKYKGATIIFLTGRTHISVIDKWKLSRAIKNTGNNYFIVNNRNEGLSSRVLKEFCFKYLLLCRQSFIYFEDRKDVIKHLIRYIPNNYTIKNFNDIFILTFDGGGKW